MNNLFFNHSWDLYINGWYHHNGIIFLPNGQIIHNGTEGFYRYEIISDEEINLYDKLGLLCYTLKYESSAKLWINKSQHRVKNNNLFIALSNDKNTYCTKFDYISNKCWAYRSSKGEIWGYLFFGIDGKIYNYNHQNECTWKISDDKLHIFNTQEEITSTSDVIDIHDCMIKLNFIPSNSVHYLSLLQAKNHLPAKYTYMDMCISNCSDTLLVTINSAAKEYNGYESAFEFHTLPYIYSVDYIRISQSAPTRWYVDSFDKIMTMIEMHSYKKVVIQGLSIGGFASLWLAESLARKNPNIQYYSIAMQPLTSLKFEFLQYLRDNFSDGARSKIPTDDLLSILPSDIELDIASMLDVPLPNVQHYVLFDRLNPAEKYSSERLKSTRVILTGFDLGVSHGNGSGKIANSSILKQLQNQLLRCDS